HIITTDLGIPIDYYALSDYGAFKSAVDAVGGVQVNIQSPNPRGLYDPYANLKLPNGIANLNGQQALNLARSRGDGPGAYGFTSSDFDRTAHQRELFTAIATKAKTIGVLANPVKIGSLFDALGNNVQTDLSLPDILQLVKISKNINLSSVQSFAFCSTLTLGQNGCNKAILTGYIDPISGQDALVPTAGIGDYSQMTQYYNQLVSNNPLSRENANIIVENGSNTSGIAGAYQTKINNDGGNVTSVNNTISIYNTSEIVDNSFGKFPGTKTYLEKMFGTKIVNSNSTLNPAGADFVVIVGNNQKLPTAN
ncbi:MAG TPA: LCP family protein, partial [Candidatus Dormibacteraeota bacterium]|nr:LCP family protein [Candidatus Dormibacteraeota bacterium]